MSAEHEELADGLEREARQLKEQSDKLGEEIDGTRQDWERKRADAAVPGAEPRDDDAPTPEPERE